MPVAATVTYAAAAKLGMERVPVASVVYYWITGLAGILLLMVAVVQCFRTGGRKKWCTADGRAAGTGD